MQIITLTTDWGTDGIYTGAFKGKLLNESLPVNPIDISHQINPHDIGQAAFTIKSCYNLYPKGTIHLLGVGGTINRQSPIKRQYIIFEKEGYYFIGNDDGIWTLIFEEPPAVVYALQSDASISRYSAFPELGIFIDAITDLTRGKKPREIGTLTTLQFSFTSSKAAIHESMINGEVIYFDNFGNAITNITKSEFERVCKNRAFEIYIGSYHSRYTINKINNEYNESLASHLLAIFSYSGFLEIAIANGRASDLLNVKQNKEVRIKFF